MPSRAPDSVSSAEGPPPEVAFGRELGNPKVQYFHGVARASPGRLGEKEILGLKVTVNDAVSVGSAHGRRHRQQQRRRPFQAQALVAQQLVPSVSPYRSSITINGEPSAKSKTSIARACNA